MTWARFRWNSAAEKPNSYQKLGFSATTDSLLPTLFATEQSYGWSVGMRAITHALLDGVDLPSGAVIDLGCGGGALLAELAGRYAGRPLWGLDQHPLAVAQTAANMPGRALQADLERLPIAGDSAALVLALDSFDQSGVNLSAALRESLRVLRDGGVLLTKVSAGPWLYGPHDVAFNTGRRYDRASMVDALSAAGFQIQRCTFADLLLGPPVAPLRLLQRFGLMPFSTSLYANRTANHIMATLLRLESRTLSLADLPFGLSLYVLARKERL